MLCIYSSLKAHLHVPVGAIPEASLEQLNPDDGKHEEEEDGHEEDVPDVLHSHNHALHHVLQTLGSVDGSKKEKCCKFIKWGAKKRSKGSLIAKKTTLYLMNKAPEGTEYPENSENLDDGDCTRADELTVYH